MMKYVVLAGVLGVVGVAALILDRIGLLLEARKTKPPSARPLDPPEVAPRRGEAGPLSANELVVMDRIYRVQPDVEPDEPAA